MNYLILKEEERKELRGSEGEGKRKGGRGEEVGGGRIEVGKGGEKEVIFYGCCSNYILVL